MLHRATNRAAITAPWIAHTRQNQHSLRYQLNRGRIFHSIEITNIQAKSQNSNLQRVPKEKSVTISAGKKKKKPMKAKTVSRDFRLLDNYTQSSPPPEKEALKTAKKFLMFKTQGEEWKRLHSSLVSRNKKCTTRKRLGSASISRRNSHTTFIRPNDGSQATNHEERKEVKINTCSQLLCCHRSIP